MNFAKVRRWQTVFETHRPFAGSAVPDLVVEEIESDPEYACDGAFRRLEPGGQVVLTLGGAGLLTVDGKAFTLHPGRAFIHNHCDAKVCYRRAPGAREPWRFLWMAFYGESAERTVTEINRHYGYVFDPGTDSGLADFLRNWRRCAGEMVLLTPLEGASLVGELFKLTCASVEDAGRREARNSLAAAAQSRLAAGGTVMGAGALAAELKVSREHLSRTFREQTGQTLREYIARLRLRDARDLLLRTRCPAKEIAERCGYSDYTVFYRAFRVRFGCSPEVFRRGGEARDSAVSGRAADFR